MKITEYVTKLNDRFNSGVSTEHSYRGDLQNLLESLLHGIQITNEPKRIKCGAPDYILARGKIPVGYIEAKNIGMNLDDSKYKEQFNRYLDSLSNLIITDYLEFKFYREGEEVTSVKIAEIKDKSIQPINSNFETFKTLIRDFVAYQGQTIKSSSTLAKLMAGKAKLMANVLHKAIEEDIENKDNSELHQQLNAFKSILIHDIKPIEFADIYSQTIAYGMFAARLHDKTLEDFSRAEAAELIPKSNPFLRKLFHNIAGPDLDSRIDWVVDALADIFRATNVAELLSSFGKVTYRNDPFIHFYETFLSEYSPKLRKKRGVWYTPEPIVSFIVRSTDEILKNEFGLNDGIADTKKITIKVKTDKQDNRTNSGYVHIEKDVHKVQILDPAVGTGTFLAETIKFIYNSKFSSIPGAWTSYVEEDLVKRLNGFELLMASYSMAHLKLDMLLTETGYKHSLNNRFNVFLTNSLEKHHPDTDTLFSSWLSAEANEANHIKKETPVMVIMGNPPYSGHSANSGEWIENLLNDYKKESDGTKLKEKNSKWLNDDYVKFIRFSQYLIDKNGEGVLAFITNNGYLDNPTFRGMRFNLLESFNKIYSIDLHGSHKKKEITSEGMPDENVFDIQQGVSIIFAIKSRNKKSKCKIYSSDLMGSREDKYKYLNTSSLSDIKFKEFYPFNPNYIFKYRDKVLYEKYHNWISVVDLFEVNVMGFQTHRDHFAIDWDAAAIKKKATDLQANENTDSEIYEKYEIKDNRDWKLSGARHEIKNDDKWEEKITVCGYRPFDNRYCYFSYVMMDYPRRELINHSLNRENIILGVGRQGVAVGDIEWCLATISKYPVDANYFRRGGVNLFPLYLYNSNDLLNELNVENSRKSNIKEVVIRYFSDATHLFYSDSNNPETNKHFTSIDVIDYIYAVLHSRSYRSKFKEFLKIDFPRIPPPKDGIEFIRLVEYGRKLRLVTLLESDLVENYITTYPIDGDNRIKNSIVKKDWKIIDKSKKLGRIWINEKQYFEGIPVTAWEFYIGGYQPAQKWLKDRKGRTLDHNDIFHYQKIIVALTETDRIMKEIDNVMKL